MQCDFPTGLILRRILWITDVSIKHAWEPERWRQWHSSSGSAQACQYWGGIWNPGDNERKAPVPRPRHYSQGLVKQCQSRRQLKDQQLWDVENLLINRWMRGTLSGRVHRSHNNYRVVGFYGLSVPRDQKGITSVLCNYGRQGNRLATVHSWI